VVLMLTILAITNCPLKTAKLQTVAEPLRFKSSLSAEGTALIKAVIARPLFDLGFGLGCA
jgi:hypothetical protein